MNATADQEKSQQLQAYHRRGAILLRLVPDHKGYGHGILKLHAEALDRPYNFLFLVRRFAIRYDANALWQLCQNPVSASHLGAHVDIDNKSQRSKIQKQTHDKKLSMAGLIELT